MPRLTYLSEDFPPYNFRDAVALARGQKAVRGIFIDVLTALNDRLDLKFRPDDVDFSPWARAYSTALNGPNAVLFATARVPSRESSFKWAGPVMPIDIGLIGKKRRYAGTTPDPEIAGLKIGAIRNDIGEVLARDAGYRRNQLFLQSDGNSLALMLAAERIDAWAYNEAAVLWYLQRNGLEPDNYDNIVPLLRTEAYFAFSLDVPDRVVAAFQEGIDELKTVRGKSGQSRLDEIIQQYR